MGSPRPLGAKRSHPLKIATRTPLREHPDVKARLLAHAEGRVSLPASASLSAFQPPVLDQGQTGACTAHSDAGAVATTCSAAGTPLGFVPSPDCTYKVTRAIERAAATPAGEALPPLTDSGAELADVNTADSRYGVKAMGPSAEGRNSDVDPATVNDEPDFAALEQAGLHLEVGEYYVDPTSADAGDVIAAAIVSGIAVKFAFFCDTAVFNWSAGDAPVGAPNLSDPNGGGHAVYCAAFTTAADGSRVWRIRNSWGSSYGDGGDFLASDAWRLAAWEAWPAAVAKKGSAS